MGCLRHGAAGSGQYEYVGRSRQQHIRPAPSVARSHAIVERGPILPWPECVQSGGQDAPEGRIARLAATLPARFAGLAATVALRLAVLRLQIQSTWGTGRARSGPRMATDPAERGGLVYNPIRWETFEPSQQVELRPALEVPHFLCVEEEDPPLPAGNGEVSLEAVLPIDAQEVGIIPARAGNRPSASGRPSCTRDHPRACGEQLPGETPCPSIAGVIGPPALLRDVPEAVRAPGCDAARRGAGRRRSRAHPD